MEIFLTERVAWETALLQGVNVVGTPPPLGSPGSAGIVPTVSSPSISPLISVQQQQFVNQTPTLNRQQQQQPFPLSFSPHLNPPFSPFAAPSQNMPPPPGLGAPFPGVTQHFSAPPQAPQSIAPALQLANQPLPPKGEGPSQMPKNLKALDAIKALGNPGLTHPASTSVPFSSVHSPASFPSPSGLNGAFWSSMNPAQAPVQYQHFRSTSLDMTNSPSPMYNRQRQVSLSARSGSPKGSPRGARGSGGNRRMQHQSPKKASSGASKSHSIDTHQRAPSPSSTGSSTHLSDASSSDGDIFGSSRRSIPSVNAGKSSPFSSESVVSSATSIYSSSGDGSKESSAPSTPKRVQAQRYRVPLLAPTIAAA